MTTSRSTGAGGESPDLLELFDALFANASDCILLSRTDGPILRANPAACAALRRTEQEILRDGRNALVVPGPELSRGLAERERSGIASGELTFRRPDGTTFQAEVTSTVIQAVGPTRYAYVLFRDLTERRRLEKIQAEALEAARARAAELQALLDAVPAAVYITRDPLARGMTTNRFGAAVMNLPTGANASKSAPPGEAPRTFKAMKDGLELPPDRLPVQIAAATGRDVLAYEFDIVAEDGAARHLIGNATPLRSEGGELAGAVGAFVDITDQIERARQLGEVKERLSNVLDASSDGYWERDLVTGTVLHSARMNEIVGYPAEDRVVDSDDWIGRMHPDDRRDVGPAYDAVLARRQDRFDRVFRTRHADGSWRWVRSRGKVTAWDQAGRPVRLSGTITDIHAGMVAQEALRSSEEHFRKLVAALPIPVAFANSRREIVTLNEKFTQVLGYARDDIPTVDDWFRRAYPEETYRQWVAENWRKRLREAVEQGGELPPLEFRVTCKDGTVRTMAISGTPMGDNILVVFLDVTQERALQAQLALASRLAAMGTLVAGVAHEINNPLAAELAGQGLALELARGARSHRKKGTRLELDAEIRLLDEVIEALEDAQEGGQRIARIVKDLSTFARPDPRRTRVRLSNVVRDAMRWLPASTSAVASILVEDRGAPDILASSGQIEQVVVNLATNAAKATPQGRYGKIVIRVGPGSPGMARLEVIDDGVGIDPGIIGRVFEPFFTTRQVGEGHGTGLGLAIVHAIVTAHGGTLTVKSEVGKGSTFRVELPVEPAMPGSTSPIPSGGQGGRGLDKVRRET